MSPDNVIEPNRSLTGLLLLHKTRALFVCATDTTWRPNAAFKLWNSKDFFDEDPHTVRLTVWGTDGAFGLIYLTFVCSLFASCSSVCALQIANVRNFRIEWPFRTGPFFYRTVCQNQSKWRMKGVQWRVSTGVTPVESLLDSWRRSLLADDDIAMSSSIAMEFAPSPPHSPIVQLWIIVPSAQGPATCLSEGPLASTRQSARELNRK